MGTVTVTARDSAGNSTVRNLTYTVQQSSDPLGPRRVWVLQQVSSRAELQNYASQIANAKQTVPALGGLGVRIAWDAYLRDKSVLDLGKQIADANNLEYSFRFMAGRWTPDAFLSEMGSAYTHTTPAGELFPKPFSSSGGAGNPVFEREFRNLLTELAQWYTNNGCRLLHCSWYAMDWAELNHGAEVRAAAGYSQNAWLEGHKRLITIAREVADQFPGVVMEFPLSGYGPLTTVSPLLADHMVAQFGAGTRRCSMQANGWSNTGQWGAPNQTTDTQMDACFTRPLARGVQAIQPWGVNTTYPQYTATQVAGAVNQAELCDADYMEIYLPSLRSVNGGSVWSAPLQSWVQS